MGFASSLRYCSDIAHWRPTKLCTIFGHLLGWYSKYTFLGLLPPDGILPSAKFTLHPSLAFSYIGSYCTALQQRASTKLCGVVQGMELETFTVITTYIRLGVHHWTSAHILVLCLWLHVKMMNV